MYNCMYATKCNTVHVQQGPQPRSSLLVGQPTEGVLPEPYGARAPDATDAGGSAPLLSVRACQKNISLARLRP